LAEEEHAQLDSEARTLLAEEEHAQLDSEARTLLAEELFVVGLLGFTTTLLPDFITLVVELFRVVLFIMEPLEEGSHGLPMELIMESTGSSMESMDPMKVQ
jgi:hypothetical protein